MDIQNIGGMPVKFVNDGWKTIAYRGYENGELIIWDVKNPVCVLDFKNPYFMDKAKIFNALYHYEIEPMLNQLSKGELCEYSYYSIFDHLGAIMILWTLSRKGYQADCLLSKDDQGYTCMKFIFIK